MTDDEREIHRMAMEHLEEDLYIDISEVIEHPPVAISKGTYDIVMSDGSVKTYPIPLCTYGNFSFVQAPPKIGKSYFTNLFASSYLAKKTNFTADMTGDAKGKLLHIDTEQGEFHAQKVFQRTARMCEFEPSNYLTFGMRKISYKSRVEMIEYLLEKHQDVKFVIIDGVADLVADVNDINGCRELVDHLMRWTAQYNIHILTIIHSNFGSNKPTGHLGSFLEKKCETQIRLERNDVNPRLITAKPMNVRNKAFEPFSFKVNDYGLPEVETDLYDVLDGF